MSTPTPLSPEQHAKLPRWASDHIASLVVRPHVSNVVLIGTVGR